MNESLSGTLHGLRGSRGQPMTLECRVESVTSASWLRNLMAYSKRYCLLHKESIYLLDVL